MVSKTEAQSRLALVLPKKRIVFYLDYNDLYLFQVFDDSDQEEGSYDPFYSVSKSSGSVSEFSVVQKGLRVKLTALWAEAHGLVLPGT